MAPGDAAPGGHVFDDAWNGSNNNAGDIAFSGHVQGDPCINIGVPLRLRRQPVPAQRGHRGHLLDRHQGDQAPGRGTYSTVFGGLVNGADQVAFEGSTGADNTPPYNVYQWSKDVTTLVAVAGEPMPGGGDYASASGNDGTFGQNDHGDISFTTALDTVTNGLNDTGAYVWSHGPLHLVARTGTVIPGVGTIARLGEFLNSNNGTNPPAYSMGEVINDRGQVFFTATLDRRDERAARGHTRRLRRSRGPAGVPPSTTTSRRQIARSGGTWSTVTATPDPTRSTDPGRCRCPNNARRTIRLQVSPYAGVAPPFGMDGDPIVSGDLSWAAHDRPGLGRLTKE